MIVYLHQNLVIPNLPCVSRNLSIIDISRKHNVNTYYLSLYLIIYISSSYFSIIYVNSFHNRVIFHCFYMPRYLSRLLPYNISYFYLLTNAAINIINTENKRTVLLSPAWTEEQRQELPLSCGILYAITDNSNSGLTHHFLCFIFPLLPCTLLISYIFHFPLKSLMDPCTQFTFCAVTTGGCIYHSHF